VEGDLPIHTIRVLRHVCLLPRDLMFFSKFDHFVPLVRSHSRQGADYLFQGFQGIGANSNGPDHCLARFAHAQPASDPGSRQDFKPSV